MERALEGTDEERALESAVEEWALEVSSNSYPHMPSVIPGENVCPSAGLTLPQMVVGLTLKTQMAAGLRWP